MQPWKITHKKQLLHAPIFTLYSQQAHSVEDPKKQGTFFYFEMPNFVNVIALTPDEKVVLVRQFRHGTQEMSLEVPGGLVDAGEDFVAAGLRELREETGGVGDEALQIGLIDANPAIQSNHCGTVLVRNVVLGERSLDHNEEIEVILVPLQQIPQMIARGEIKHTLVVSAFYHLHIHQMGLTE